MSSKVAVIFTRPESVIEDYQRVMELADYRQSLTGERELLLKLNLSWTKYFPACSSQPWQVEGVVKTLLDGPYTPETLLPVENKTVVTNPIEGAKNNLWMPVLDRYGCRFPAAHGCGVDRVRVPVGPAQAQPHLSRGHRDSLCVPRPGHPSPPDGQDPRTTP